MTTVAGTVITPLVGVTVVVLGNDVPVAVAAETLVPVAVVAGTLVPVAVAVGTLVPVAVAVGTLVPVAVAVGTLVPVAVVAGVLVAAHELSTVVVGAAVASSAAARDVENRVAVLPLPLPPVVTAPGSACFVAVSTMPGKGCIVDVPVGEGVDVDVAVGAVVGVFVGNGVLVFVTDGTAVEVTVAAPTVGVRQGNNELPGVAVGATPVLLNEMSSRTLRHPLRLIGSVTIPEESAVKST